MTAVALPTATTIVNTGVDAVFTAAAAGGNTFQNNGKQFLEIQNQSTHTITVTIDAFPTGCTATEPDDLSVTDRQIGVEGNTTVIVGPFQPSIYNNATGAVTIDFDEVTDLSVAVLQFDANPN